LPVFELQAAPTLEVVRDISFASQVIRDMSGAASLDDPLSDRYSKLDCSIIPMERGHDDFIMILKYLQKTYEPIEIRNEVIECIMRCTQFFFYLYLYGGT